MVRGRTGSLVKEERGEKEAVRDEREERDGMEEVRDEREEVRGVVVVVRKDRLDGETEGKEERGMMLQLARKQLIPC